MPIYEHTFVRNRLPHRGTSKSSPDPPLKKCKRCRRETWRRSSRGRAFSLGGGSGWYVTDYSEQAPTTSAGNGEKGTEKKTEERNPERRLFIGVDHPGQCTA